jgi:hypothetical protein
VRSGTAITKRSSSRSTHKSSPIVDPGLSTLLGALKTLGAKLTPYAACPRDKRVCGGKEYPQSATPGCPLRTWLNPPSQTPDAAQRFAGCIPCR